MGKFVVGKKYFKLFTKPYQMAAEVLRERHQRVVGQ